MISPRIKLILAFGVVYLVWGSTYLAMKIAIETLPPFMMAGSRFMSAGMVLLIIHRIQARRHTPDVPIRWKHAFIAGGLLLLGGNGAVVYAQQFVPSSITAIVIATVPLWTAFIESFGGKTPLPKRVWVGIFMGFCGILFLMLPNQNHAPIPIIGLIILLGAACSWSLGSIYTRHIHQGGISSKATGMEMISGGTLLLLISLLRLEPFHLDWTALSWRSLGAFGYLVFFGALLGFSAYKYMLKHTSPTLSSTYAYINPLIAIFLGCSLGGEPLTQNMLGGSAMIISAVILMTFSIKPIKKTIPVTEPQQML